MPDLTSKPLTLATSFRGRAKFLPVPCTSLWNWVSTLPSNHPRPLSSSPTVSMGAALMLAPQASGVPWSHQAIPTTGSLLFLSSLMHSPGAVWVPAWPPSGSVQMPPFLRFPLTKMLKCQPFILGTPHPSSGHMCTCAQVSTSKRAGVQACSHPWDMVSIMTSCIYLLVASFIRTGSARFIHSLSPKPRAEPRTELALCQSCLSEGVCPGWDGIWQLRGGCARGEEAGWVRQDKSAKPQSTRR